MNNTNETKALKKQLMAAIAMVMVAAVALTSATYAWFVSNNSVKATTSSISAQSNSAFMVIQYDTTAVSSDKTEDSATILNTALFPAQWKNNFAADKSTTGEKIYQFETAFGKSPLAAGYEMETTSLKAIGDPAVAVNEQYAVKNTFNISSKGSNLTALKVAAASIADDNKGNNKLDDALRVLVVCGENWVLCDKNSIVQSSNTENSGYLAETVEVGKDTQVDMYVYYDGNNTEIYTNNLAELTNESSKITVQFDATAPTN